MKPARLKIFLFLLPAYLIVSCQSQPSGQIIGQWTGRDSGGNEQVFVFRTDSTALWIFNPSSAQADTFNLQYTIIYKASPTQLDLTGFNRGFLKGRTLYGIVEFAGADTFRVDFEPGPPDTNAADVRPRTFTEQTVTYTRQE